MSKERPDHADADLVLKLYELRREAVMRKSRALVTAFLPKSWDELIAVTKPDHAMNAAFRQVSTYWEMAYGIAKHGIVHPEYFMENEGEGLLLFVKIEPHLVRYRQEVSALSFLNSEWVATKTERGRLLMELFRKRFGIAAAKA
jgi:hypothetical protein